jgi:hypothetical protein
MSLLSDHGVNRMKRLVFRILAAYCVVISGGCNQSNLQASSSPSSAVPALAWEKGHPERISWSAELRNQISSYLADFDKAPDLADFCPAYSTISAQDRVSVLATIIVGIAKYESNYNPKEHFGEPPPLGYDSIGLFQLSYEDGFSWCRLDRKTKSLENPLINIQCAVPEMARLTVKDKIFAAGKTSDDAEGLAKYWSVLREGSKHHLDDIKKLSRSLAICK